MEIRVEVAGEHATDQLRSLRQWLVDEETLRGRVRLVAGAPEEGTLGAGVDALAIALENGGAATAFATVAVTWLRRRAGRMEVKVVRADGSTVEISADLVRPQTARELRETAQALARDLAPVDEGTEG